MARRGVLYAVFLLPVLFSVIFGTAVMADILQKPDRELNMWRFGQDGHDEPRSELVEIIGLEEQYTTSQPVTLEVIVSDPAFECGDLYITIYSDDDLSITQRGFFSQCVDQGQSVLPVDERFSEIIDVPGTYRAVIELTDNNQQNSLVTSEMFTVK